MQIAPSGREGEVGNLVTRSLWLSNSEGWSPALLCHMLVADSFLYHGLHLLIPKMETGEKAGDQGSSVSSVPLLSLLTHFIQQSPGWVWAFPGDKMSCQMAEIWGSPASPQLTGPAPYGNG